MAQDAGPTLEDKIEKMFLQEMGFAMVAELMVKSLGNKPLIGHNLMYDALYFYNQFIDDLPDSYLLFAQKWYGLF